MRGAAGLALLAVLTLGAAPVAAGAAAVFVDSLDQRSYGVWSNPKGSVHIEVRPCGQAACGYVVWANAKAQADARKGGTEDLIGKQLFQNFVRDADGTWRGKVFVPDLNRTFSGTAEAIDARTLRARGCLFMGLGCKAQIWTRIDNP